ncbi:MAG: DMT family transporter [Alphaproteobacteria bacterium]|nr:DMT family transporter [Alphaproteobacteria bacterium]
MQQTMTARHWSIVLLTGALFGSSFLFIHVAVAEIPPLTMAAGRAALAMPVALVFLLASGRRLPPLGAAWIPLIMLGLLTAAIPYAAIAWGQRYIASGLAGILFGTIPVFAVLAGSVLLAGEERLSLARLTGALVGLAGVVLVIGPKALAGIESQMLGAGVTLGAAFSYTLGTIYARTRKELDPVVMTAGQLLVGAVVLTLAALVTDAPWQLAPSAAAIGAVAATAVLGTALPSLLLFWLVRNAGASNASLATFFIPVMAVALGAVMLGESLPWTAFAGLGLILLGAAGVGGKLKRGVKVPAASSPTRG